MEGRAAPEEFEVAIAGAISAPEAFGASFDAAPSAEELELGSGLEGDPAIAFRRTLGMFATGVTVLTTLKGESVHGMTANAFMSVSLRPPQLLAPIVAVGVKRGYADAEPSMRIGEPGDELLLVVEGTVRVERPGHSVTLGAGELIGEIEVLDSGGGRIADIHAEGPV